LIIIFFCIKIHIVIHLTFHTRRYGLTDIQEYYANTGALKTAAENNRDTAYFTTSFTDFDSSFESYFVGTALGASDSSTRSKLTSMNNTSINSVPDAIFGTTSHTTSHTTSNATSNTTSNTTYKRTNKVAVSVVEAYEKNVKPKELDELLRMEYRTKLLNPKWCEVK
jgi:cobalamin biosynthesis Mg chelatase CobN